MSVSIPRADLRLILRQLNCFQHTQRILQGPLPLSLLLLLPSWRLHPAQGHVVQEPCWMLHGTMVHRDPHPDLRVVQRQFCEDEINSLKMAEEQHWVRGAGGKGEGSHKSVVGCTTSVFYEEKTSWILLKTTARKMYFKCLYMNLPIYHAVCFIGCNISLLTKSFLQLTCVFSASSDKTKGNKIISFPHFFNFVCQKTRSLKGHILIEFLFYPPVVLK